MSWAMKRVVACSSRSQSMDRIGKADQAGLADLLYRSFIESLACYLFGRFDEPFAAPPCFPVALAFKLMFKVSVRANTRLTDSTRSQSDFGDLRPISPPGL
jgi:hypothetical protein